MPRAHKGKYCPSNKIQKRMKVNHYYYYVPKDGLPTHDFFFISSFIMTCKTTVGVDHRNDKKQCTLELQIIFLKNN